MTYRIILCTLHGSTTISGGCTLAAALEECRQRYGVKEFHCEAAVLLEQECSSCAHVDIVDTVCAAEGCRAICSEPLRLYGSREEYSHLRLERTP